MKKFIKYLGITSTILLTIVPVGVSISANTVKADETTTVDDTAEKKTATVSYKSQITVKVGYSLSDVDMAVSIKDKDGNEMVDNTQNGDDFFEGSMDGKQLDDNTFEKPGKYVRVLNCLLKDAYNSENYEYNIQPYDNERFDGRGVRFLQEVDVVPDKETATANIDKTISVTAGTSKNSSVLSDTSKDTLTSDKTLLADNPVVGLYYDADPNSNSKAKEVTDPLNNAGTYYRVLKFTLKDGLSATDYDFGATASVSGNIVTYYQPITVTKKSSSGGSSSSSNSSSHETNNNESNWSYTKKTGYVTTRTDSEYYTLKDNDNKIIENRVLAANTSWTIDETRVKDGSKQYRVATDEWIDADDVNYNVPVAGLGDVKNISGVVKCEGKSDYYLLYTDKVKLVRNRALSKDSAWKADKIAKDNDGNTYYHVATNEWVKVVSGVYLTKK